MNGKEKIICPHCKKQFEIMVWITSKIAEIRNVTCSNIYCKNAPIHDFKIRGTTFSFCKEHYQEEIKKQIGGGEQMTKYEGINCPLNGGLTREEADKICRKCRRKLSCFPRKRFPEMYGVQKPKVNK